MHHQAYHLIEIHLVLHAESQCPLSETCFSVQAQTLKNFALSMYQSLIGNNCAEISSSALVSILAKFNVPLAILRPNPTIYSAFR